LTILVNDQHHRPLFVLIGIMNRGHLVSLVDLSSRCLLLSGAWLGASSALGILHTSQTRNILIPGSSMEADATQAAIIHSRASGSKGGVH